MFAQYLLNKQITMTDKAVIIDAEDTSELIRSLKVKTLAVKGE